MSMETAQPAAPADPDAADPRPEAPEPPGPDDCCHSGCTWCVDTLYQDALDEYRAKLQAWLQRHPQ
ncbi:oxidoreductase-like protein [Pseudoduganella sp. LjRoot289]|uniref:oxidoreductase-like domain-containing protein n=1 Tax=Pseudoduganella sp. LjRoot289 TaxID=3342314 RepID=UPI003ECE9307